MWLMALGIEASHSKREIHRIQVVKIVAPKDKAGNRDRNGKQSDFQSRPKNHVAVLSNCNAIPQTRPECLFNERV
jgi:hypothetical protein